MKEVKSTEIEFKMKIILPFKDFRNISFEELVKKVVRKDRREDVIEGQVDNTRLIVDDKRTNKKSEVTEQKKFIRQTIIEAAKKAKVRRFGRIDVCYGEVLGVTLFRKALDKWGIKHKWDTAEEPVLLASFRLRNNIRPGNYEFNILWAHRPEFALTGRWSKDPIYFDLHNPGVSEDLADHFRKFFMKEDLYWKGRATPPIG
jgi:hypothetical protein